MDGKAKKNAGSGCRTPLRSHLRRCGGFRSLRLMKPTKPEPASNGPGPETDHARREADNRSIESDRLRPGP